MSEIEDLRTANAALRLEVTRLERYVTELREAIDALMQPAPSELLARNKAHRSRRV